MRRNSEGQATTDHPQPLLERRRGDDSGSVDAFSRALKDEKNPIVRAYAENLRRQIATIAAKHGANARDVWNKEVQDRMSVDEMDAVNALFVRIKAMAEKKISRADAREMLSGLEAKEERAREMMAEVMAMVQKSPVIFARVPETIAERYLKAGMVEDAVAVADAHRDAIDHLMYAGIQLARAKTFEKDFDDWYRLAIGRAITALRECRWPDTFVFDLDQRANLREVVEIVERWMRMMTDEQFDDDDEVLEFMNTQDVRLYPILFPSIFAEAMRRGKQRMSGIETIREDAYGRAERNQIEQRIDHLLLDAELANGHGKDPRPIYQEALALMNTKDHFSRTGRAWVAEKFAESVGLTGAFDLLDEVSGPSWRGVTRRAR